MEKSSQFANAYAAMAKSPPLPPPRAMRSIKPAVPEPDSIAARHVGQHAFHFRVNQQHLAGLSVDQFTVIVNRRKRPQAANQSQMTHAVHFPRTLDRMTPYRGIPFLSI